MKKHWSGIGGAYVAWVAWVAWILALVWLSGCASISVLDETFEAEGQPDSLPEKIYLVRFKAPEAVFAVDRQGEELTAFRKEFVDYFSSALWERLDKAIAPTVVVNSLKEVPSGACWIIQGSFTKVNQGSRALRAGIGFGAGGTKLETEVDIFNHGNGKCQRFHSFKTTGGSNAEPGAISAIGPGGVTLVAATAAASAGGGMAHGLSEDATRTARVIVAAISDYAFSRGWISIEERKVPKRVE